MTQSPQVITSFYQSWHEYQDTLIRALTPLTAEQLGMRLAPKLLSVGEIAAHIVKNRAVWFYSVMQEKDEAFVEYSKWNVYGEPAESASMIVDGLNATWKLMHDLIAGWTAEDWEKTFPDEEDDNTPDILTRPWVLWHMIEHDIHHGGEISIMLGSFGLDGLKLSG